MDFKLNAQQEEFLKKIKKVCMEEIAPGASEIDSGNKFPSENLSRLASEGLQASMIAGEFGGAGNDLALGVHAIEVVSRACPSTGMAVGTSMFCIGKTIETHATAELKKDILPELAKGSIIGAPAVSEKESGSDISYAGTTAEKKNGAYIINGTKICVINATESGIILVPAKTGDSISLFCVDSKTPGVKTGDPYKTLGLRGACACDVIFDNCEIPEKCLVGAEGEGMKIINDALDFLRLCIAAVANGISGAAFDISKDFSENEQAFGKPLATRQPIAFRITDIFVETDIARMLTYQAAWKKSQNMNSASFIALSKLCASETAVRNTNRAINVLGGAGIVQNCAAERLYRDAKLTEVLGGDSDLMRGIVAEDLLDE
ncbi:MAG TPA: acyl-CoA dehydrogenase family protein [bacterium]|nr:acyl-CoA dehydrogenase family protein [bacterium]